MELKDKFLQHIGIERRLSNNTVETYAESLKLFLEFLHRMPDPRELETADSDNIREWMEALMEQGRSAAYVNRSLAALRTFYKYCLTQGIISLDPAHHITGPKKAKRLPQVLRDNEVNRLLDNMQEQMQTGENKDINIVRARTIIYILYLTGLRASELISLDDSMIDVTTKEIKVTGKRNKQRIIPFGEELLKVITEYTSIRDLQVKRTDDAFLVNNKGKRVTYEQVRRIVKNNLQTVSSLKKCSPHALRHTFATSMLNNDANLESIKKLLGHQSLETTEVYTHVTFEKLKKTYNEAHPRG